MLLLLTALRLTNSSWHVPLVFAGFFNLLMNAGPNSTTFTLAPILFPTQLCGIAGGIRGRCCETGCHVSEFFPANFERKIGCAERAWSRSGRRRAGAACNIAARA